MSWHSINWSNVYTVIIVLISIVGYIETACTNKMFQRIGGIHSSYAYSVITSASREKCAIQCLEDKDCLMISYREHNKTCGLSEKWFDDTGVTASVDDSSEVFFDTNRFETVIITTPDRYIYYLIEDFGVSVSGVPFLLFQVQACSHVYVLLCQDRTQVYGDIYEIVIGGWDNSISVIRLTFLGEAVTTYTHQPLSCDTPRPFWISWFEDSIQVGTGRTIGRDGFLSTPNLQNININCVGVSTGWGATGSWTFNKRIH